MKTSKNEMSGKEFAFIREQAGLSLRKMALISGRVSQYKLARWEKKEKLRLYQIRLLREIFPVEFLTECREIWNKQEQERKSEEAKNHCRIEEKEFFAGQEREFIVLRRFLDWLFNKRKS